MSEEEETVLICQLVEDTSPGSVVPLSVKMPCEECSRDVYISPSGTRIIAKHEAIILCGPCALARQQEDDWKIQDLNEDQLEEFRQHGLNPEEINENFDEMRTVMETVRKLYVGLVPVGGDHERFMVRTNGGPHPGTRYVPANIFPWPLPEVLSDPEGRGVYRKISESLLPEQEPDSRILRGAEYEWEPSDADAVDPD